MAHTENGLLRLLDRKMKPHKLLFLSLADNIFKSSATTKHEVICTLTAGQPVKKVFVQCLEGKNKGQVVILITGLHKDPLWDENGINDIVVKVLIDDDATKYLAEIFKAAFEERTKRRAIVVEDLHIFQRVRRFFRKLAQQ